LATFCPFTGCTSPLGGCGQHRLLEGEARASIYVLG
jgi:hypothetical protein